MFKAFPISTGVNGAYQSAHKEGFGAMHQLSFRNPQVTGTCFCMLKCIKDITLNVTSAHTIQHQSQLWISIPMANMARNGPLNVVRYIPSAHQITWHESTCDKCQKIIKKAEKEWAHTTSKNRQKIKFRWLFLFGLLSTVSEVSTWICTVSSALYRLLNYCFRSFQLRFVLFHLHCTDYLSTVSEVFNSDLYSLIVFHLQCTDLFQMFVLTIVSGLWVSHLRLCQSMFTLILYCNMQYKTEYLCFDTNLNSALY